MSRLLCSITMPSLSGSSVQVLGPNPKRHGILFQCFAGVRITYAPRQPAVDGQGIVAFPSNPPIKLWGDMIGEAIKEEWYAITNGGTATVTIFEFFWP